MWMVRCGKVILSCLVAAASATAVAPAAATVYLLFPVAAVLCCCAVKTRCYCYAGVCVCFAIVVVVEVSKLMMSMATAAVAVTAVPVEERRLEEARWIREHWFASRPRECEEAIATVLTVFQKDKAEVPFVAQYRKEQYFSFFRSDELYDIWEADIEWRSIEARRQQLFKRLPQLTSDTMELEAVLFLFVFFSLQPMHFVDRSLILTGVLIFFFLLLHAAAVAVAAAVTVTVGGGGGIGIIVA